MTHDMLIPSDPTGNIRRKLIQDITAPIVFFRITQDGDDRITQTSDKRIVQVAH